MFRISNLVFSIFLGFIFLSGCQNQQLYKDTRVIMGTFVEVISPDERAGKIAFSEIKRIEDLFSKYKADTELSRLNKKGKLKVSSDMLFVLKQAKEFHRLSEGAFDITVGPLMDLWGFTKKEYSLPKEEQIKKALKFVGMEKIVFNEVDNVVKFKTLGMKIDLGAIAKGYAVDCAINKLKEEGIKSALINAGGDIYCLGDKFGAPRINPFGIIRGKPWKVAIKDPRKEAFLHALDLKDKAVATSGDYEQYFTRDNKHYSHIFNPQTGYPAESGVISVTVVADDCLTADALATAIFVLGKEKGEALAKKFKDVEVEIIEEKDVSHHPQKRFSQGHR